MPITMKDQERARRAYTLVEGVSQGKREDFKISMNGLGANIIRLGLSAALAELQRRKDRGGQEVLEHLTEVLNEARLPGLGNGLSADLRDNDNYLVSRINNLEAEHYMLVTRELMAQISWFRRAVQALL